MFARFPYVYVYQPDLFIMLKCFHPRHGMQITKASRMYWTCIVAQL